MADALGFEVMLPLPFSDAMQHTRDALQSEGFGILTEIDLQKAFKEKLGRDFRPYTILGACNPPLAFAAVSADPAVGLLLPCNVALEAHDADHTLVRLTDPAAMLSATGDPRNLPAALRDVSADARGRMERVVRTLQRVAGPAA